MKRSGSTCRLRKCSCPDCGYTVRVTRSWMTVGLPGCPCGGTLEPTAPADLAWIGRIGADDMPAAAWTVICRENGWEAAILRSPKAQRQYDQRVAREPVRRGAEHCSYAGCGRWIAAGADRCTAGHAQGSDVCELEPSMPF